MEFVSSPVGISRKVATAVAGLMILASGLSFAVRGGGNNQIIQKWESNIQSNGSGASIGGKSVANMTSSGSLSLSGSLLVGDEKTGSGKLTVSGSDGAKNCFADTDGAGYTRFDCNNGTCTSAVATGGECP